VQARRLSGTAEEREALSRLLCETVAAGGSVSFMHPLEPQNARAFWDDALSDAASGGRVVFGAFEGEELVGAVTLFLIAWPNQPHRGEVGKLMTFPGRRGRGAGRLLMATLEAAAKDLGRSLLVLDTAADGGAAGFYERLGWRFCGEIPDFALKPHGGLTATRFYWKRLEGGGP
jgi:GNAT superfamily N-acetyltransferase